MLKILYRKTSSNSNLSRGHKALLKYRSVFGVRQTNEKERNKQVNFLFSKNNKKMKNFVLRPKNKEFPIFILFFRNIK